MEVFDNYKIFIYIILFILYLIFSGKKKKPQSVNTPQTKPSENEFSNPTYQKKTSIPTQEPTQPQSPEPFSLEDILKEFGNTLEIPQPSVPEKKIEYAEPLEKNTVSVVDYDENIGDEIEDLEENVKEHSVLDEKSLTTDAHFQPYTLDHQQKNKYAAMLKDPEGIRAAFVASEIFTRKYF
ncbi:MAG: hypothetical protein K2X86_04975 [Cytophagaceae bacterium]|nr:hypothetical protein [Cytophagaceae bacterium]